MLFELLAFLVPLLIAFILFDEQCVLLLEVPKLVLKVIHSLLLLVDHLLLLGKSLELFPLIIKRWFEWLISFSIPIVRVHYQFRLFIHFKSRFIKVIL